MSVIREVSLRFWDVSILLDLLYDDIRVALYALCDNIKASIAKILISLEVLLLIKQPKEQKPYFSRHIS